MNKGYDTCNVIDILFSIFGAWTRIPNVRIIIVQSHYCQTYGNMNALARSNMTRIPNIPIIIVQYHYCQDVR